jgi:hypothetical protein
MTGQRIITVPNFSAGWAVIWGMCVMSPWSSVFSSNPKLYAPMLDIIPYEAVWGGFFFATGIATWVLSYFKKPAIGALLLFVAYSLFAGLYYAGDPGSTGSKVYAYAAIVHLIFGLWGLPWTHPK